MKLTDMIIVLGEIAEDGVMNEFDRAFIDSVVERTGNGIAPVSLQEGEADRVERIYRENCRRG